MAYTVRKALCGALVLATTVGGVGATVAGAQGKAEQGNGRSICHFSGLNDDPEAEFPEDGRTQTYGQIVRRGLKSVVPSPGIACNPTKGAEEPH